MLHHVVKTASPYPNGIKQYSQVFTRGEKHKAKEVKEPHGQSKFNCLKGQISLLFYSILSHNLGRSSGHHR